MSIHVALNHITYYRYDRVVQLSPHVVRLRPAPHCRTNVLAYSLKIDPAQHFINWQQDPQANYLARVTFPNSTQILRLEVDLVVEMAALNPFDFFLEPYARVFPFAYEGNEREELTPYLTKLAPGQRLQKYLASIPRAASSTVDFLVQLNRSVAHDIRYLVRAQPGVQTPEETLERAAGSCRDSAWLLVQLLRHLGLAARFVSGYLIQLKADQPPLQGPSGPINDFTDLHAWCEVYLPGGGWIGFDPTSGLMAGEGHIPLACAIDPSSAAPVTGSVEESEVQFDHSMRVERIWEAPRVTKPYTESQWTEINAAGLAVDADLAALDVRLTMGGEPTFVAIEHADSAEWSTAALGEHKHRLARTLYDRLKARYAPHGLSHFGQGKWYPGESLPRWALSCFWRRDGEPMWQDPQLFADANSPHRRADDAAARDFLGEVAMRLGVPVESLFPAYEDSFYYLWRERRLPGNVDPFDSRLPDPQERARLRRLFQQGLDRAIGYVLPLTRSGTGSRWHSGPWFLREERCYLTPGDSPIGYRLPLDSLPWVLPAHYPYVHAQDPTQAFPALPSRAEIRRQLGLGIAGQGTDLAPAPAPAPAPATAPARAPELQRSAPWIIRTAMCTEMRSGLLHVFMPPVERLEDYLELVAAVEQVAQSLSQPIVLEGYEPPADPRLESFRITPDPGVIEVNVHPAASWGELTERTIHLYEQARQCQLTTEKFMLDGRHTGTGGGNHFVLGGPSAVDSPFLRRPDLLRSLLAYWHNHPALSYLFSSLFLGPTSQAPRIDEARDDSLYELEIAFQQLPSVDESCPPWLTDRLFRNLLTDVTGNTHRSEFCIDKLYSPDTAAGRQGLLELRAFEMPPHARMSLAQQLLLRSLVARFWRTPYAPVRLTRWGTQLHDRFMLPYFVEQDFAYVIAEQNAAGYPLHAEWFAPHLEFRFPKHGDFAARAIEVELRQALEPWHVMGEEGTAGGTARHVDSSVERLQVKVSGMAPDRYWLACNGRGVPLQPTGIAGQFVAGVRYRAWQPPSSLHPTIGVHTPLVFDLVDTWMQRSLGGCQYHVMHPGGRSYETLPVNAFESEGRRRGRFFRLGHTAGIIPVRPEPANPDFPFTLDLRRGATG